MADIELVIKMSKRVYNYIRKYEHIANSDALDIKDAIINGTPLPKGHGRLIDEQQIIDRFKPIEIFKYWCVGTDGLFNILSDAQTIIEKDTESEVKE